ncbi:DUF2927 domain-containing protein [Pseudooceanicola sp. HF7]|nr:DUF2927 domain-containing protein [Pseudooceanicola sp. HF7]
MVQVASGWRHAARRALPLVLLLALAGCEGILGSDLAPSEAPRPVPPAPRVTVDPNAHRDKVLLAYYARQQEDALVRGLLRVDGGGPDSTFDTQDLVRNFEKVAFHDEHLVGADKADLLRRWTVPVRVSLRFGEAVPKAVQARDRKAVAHYVERLNKLTGHDIRMSRTEANFLVLILDEADRPAAIADLKTRFPALPAATERQLRNLPIGVHCLVLGFAAPGSEVYDQAVAIIRAEHPPLMRMACIHEELAQGLGLRNDSTARPSIFNDDMEFALLTSQDELMLKMLYDPRLSPGMSLPEARPMVQTIAQELMGGGPS